MRSLRQRAWDPPGSALVDEVRRRLSARYPVTETDSPAGAVTRKIVRWFVIHSLRFVLERPHPGAEPFATLSEPLKRWGVGSGRDRKTVIRFDGCCYRLNRPGVSILCLLVQYTPENCHVSPFHCWPFHSESRTMLIYNVTNHSAHRTPSRSRLEVRHWVRSRWGLTSDGPRSGRT